MAVTIDGDALLITLESGVTQVTAESIYSDWKRWLNNGPPENNRKYPPAFGTSGGETLTPGLEAGAYYRLRNDLGWRMKPPEENITIYLDGNLTAADPTVDLLIPTVGTFTAAVFGIQPITQNVAGLVELISDTAFAGSLWYDSNAATDGLGTRADPCNTYATLQAVRLANPDIRTVHIHGSVVLLDGWAGYEFIGQGADATVEFDMGGGNIANSTLRNLIAYGDVGSTYITCEDCFFPRIGVNPNAKALINFIGIFRRCLWGEGVFVCQTGATYLEDCVSSRETGAPSVFRAQDGAFLYAHRYTGNIEAEAFDNTNRLEVNVLGGTFYMPGAEGGQGVGSGNPQATGCPVVVSGQGDAVITATGMLLNTAALLRPVAQLTNELIDYVEYSGSVLIRARKRIFLDSTTKAAATVGVVGGPVVGKEGAVLELTYEAVALGSLATSMGWKEGWTLP